MFGSKPAAIAAVLGLALAGCSGMGAGSTQAGVPAVPSTAQNGISGAPASIAAAPAAIAPDGKGGNKTNANAINAVNALGSPVKTYNDEMANEPHTSTQTANDAVEVDARGPGNGSCVAGIEFFVPDKSGDPSSTETEDFYDAACTQLARDVVRKFTAGSVATSETVQRTVSEYALGNTTTPTSVRNATTNFTNGTFGKNGFPHVQNGYLAVTSSQLQVGTSKSVLSNSETVMTASTNSVNNYCMDSAGYNALGISKLGLTFGWQGGALSGGTRTKNADGSVTWSATHAGETESAPIGGLSIVTGTQNTACPIATADFTLTGGTEKGTYSIPIVVTYKHGVIENLTVTNASLASGYTLNVKTNTNVWPTKTSFINGTVSNGTATVAIFDVNAFGNGTLTVAATGNQFPISDWNVVR